MEPLTNVRNEPGFASRIAEGATLGDLRDIDDLSFA